MARIMNRLRKLAIGWLGSPSQRWKALPIRGIREIRGSTTHFGLNRNQICQKDGVRKIGKPEFSDLCTVPPLRCKIVSLLSPLAPHPHRARPTPN